MIFLALPDKRFTFDLVRKTTAISDWLGWYLRELEKPSANQILDHFSNFREISTAHAWRDPHYDGSHPTHDLRQSFDLAKTSVEQNKYIDAHCSVFTPYSFVFLVKDLRSMGIFPYRISAFESTKLDDIEFFVILQIHHSSPTSQLDTSMLQQLARTAGYSGPFGSGGFARALDSDPDLKYQYETLIKEQQIKLKQETSRDEYLFPQLDKNLHHERPNNSATNSKNPYLQYFLNYFYKNHK